MPGTDGAGVGGVELGVCCAAVGPVAEFVGDGVDGEDHAAGVEAIGGPDADDVVYALACDPGGDVPDLLVVGAAVGRALREGATTSREMNGRTLNFSELAEKSLLGLA